MSKIEFCYIEEGDFLMGSTLEEIEIQIKMFSKIFKGYSIDLVRSWFLKQYPKMPVKVKSFDMSRTLVTKKQFNEFQEYIWGNSYQLSDNEENMPIEGVSFMRANQFCQWFTEVKGIEVRLPTEVQWEFAASSRGQTMFPWGNFFDPNLVNTAEKGPGKTTNVYSYPEGSSKQGVLDLGGNLEEWTSSIYLPYSGGKFIEDEISIENFNSYPILRGGCYKHHGDLTLATRRHGYRKGYTPTGFRLVKNIK